MNGARGTKSVILGFRIPTTYVGARGERARRSEWGQRGEEGGKGEQTILCIYQTTKVTITSHK